MKRTNWRKKIGASLFKWVCVRDDLSTPLSTLAHTLSAETGASQHTVYNYLRLHRKGFESQSDYYAYLAGTGDPFDYLNALAQREGFDDFSHYRRVLRAERKREEPPHKETIKERKESIYLGSEIDYNTNPAQFAILTEETEALSIALKRLSAKQRTALVGWAYGLSQGNLSQRIGTSRQNISQLQRCALKSIRDTLGITGKYSETQHISVDDGEVVLAHIVSKSDTPSREAIAHTINDLFHNGENRRTPRSIDHIFGTRYYREKYHRLHEKYLSA